MSFTFHLASVLRYRKRTEDTRALVLAVAERARAAAAARRVALLHEVGARRDAIRLAGDRGATGRELQDLDEAVLTTAQEAEAAAAELAQAGARAEAAREELMHAARDRRSLERLREMERAAFLKVQAGAEQTLLDELGGVRDAFRRAAEQGEADR